MLKHYPFSKYCFGLHEDTSVLCDYCHIALKRLTRIATKIYCQEDERVYWYIKLHGSMDDIARLMILSHGGLSVCVRLASAVGEGHSDTKLYWWKLNLRKDWTHGALYHNPRPSKLTTQNRTKTNRACSLSRIKRFV